MRIKEGYRHNVFRIKCFEIGNSSGIKSKSLSPVTIRKFKIFRILLPWSNFCCYSNLVQYDPAFLLDVIQLLIYKKEVNAKEITKNKRLEREWEEHYVM